MVLLSEEPAHGATGLFLALLFYDRDSQIRHRQPDCFKSLLLPSPFEAWFFRTCREQLSY